MAIIRTTLGALALTAALVGTVCGVLGLGTHTVAYPWLVGLVALLGWDAIWYVQHRRAKDPVTFRYNIEEVYAMRQPPPLNRTTTITTPHGDTTFHHPYQTPEHRATWPSGIGYE